MAYDFTQLRIWRSAIELLKRVYALTSEYPRNERFVLIDQTKRAALSVAANIAESHGRHFHKDKIRTLYISRGEVEEVRSHLLVARELGYDGGEQITSLVEDYNVLSKRINAYIARIKSDG